MFLIFIVCTFFGASTARYLQFDHYQAQAYGYGNGQGNYNHDYNIHIFPERTSVMRSDAWGDLYGSAPEYRGGYNQRGYTSVSPNSNNNHGNYENNQENYGVSDYNNEYGGSEGYSEYKGAVYSGGGYSRIPTLALISVSPDGNTNYGNNHGNAGSNSGYNGYGNSDFNNNDNYFGGYNDDYRGGGYRDSSYGLGSYNDYGYGNNDGYGGGSNYDSYDSDGTSYRGGAFSGRRRK